MKIDTGSIEELKDYQFDLADSKEAYKYDEITKKIGEYVGQVYGKDMKLLVVSGKESTMVKPTYPSGNNPSDEEKAIWSKEYDL